MVSCQDEKSQIKNREKAMRVLRARLYEVEQQKQQDALAKERKQQWARAIAARRFVLTTSRRTGSRTIGLGLPSTS